MNISNSNFDSLVVFSKSNSYMPGLHIQSQHINCNKCLGECNSSAHYRNVNVATVTLQ